MRVNPLLGAAAMLLFVTASEHSASGQCTDLSPPITLGPVSNPTGVEQVLASTIVSRPGAPTIRVYSAGGEVFDQGSYLRITSIADGLSQRIDSSGIAQWRWSSAWFNGDSVFVELVCAPNSKGNSIMISRTCQLPTDEPEQGCTPCANLPALTGRTQSSS